MAVIAESRQALDDAIADPVVTLFLLSGPTGGVERRVHDIAEANVLQPFQKAFLITNLTLLTGSEREQWFSANGQFAVSKGAPRVTIVQGPVSPQLLTAAGNPSKAKILKVVSA